MGITNSMAHTSEKELSASCQIYPDEGIVKTHLAKVNFDREALDMDIRYISEPEKVEAECKAKEEAAEAERKALAKREAAREKARLKAEEKKRKEDEKNRLILEDRDKAVEIYLTETELQALYDNATGREERPYP